MLYEFLYSLHTYFTPLRVFRYVTFRTASAGITAMLICLVLGPWLIRRLRSFQIGQQIREDGPSSHFNKAGTPTMGGILILIGVLVPTLLWSNLTNLYVWIAMLATFCFAVVGFLDDYAKISRKRSLGMTARMKLLYQTLIALGVCAALYYLSLRGLYSNNLSVLQGLHPEPRLLVPAGAADCNAPRIARDLYDCGFVQRGEPYRRT